jgi:hypothetical protein
VADAVAVSTDARKDVPEALLKVWKAGLKMRQFFELGDVQVRWWW